MPRKISRKILNKTLPLLLVFLGFQSAAISEVLNMPVPAETTEKENTTAVMPAPPGEMPTEPSTPSRFSVTLPGHGMTMTQVEEKFGAPLEKSPEVGDPPINRWIYNNFTVYFEYQYVINAVTNINQ
jgi:hypothetical protein